MTCFIDDSVQLLRRPIILVWFVDYSPHILHCCGSSVSYFLSLWSRSSWKHTVLWLVGWSSVLWLVERFVC